MMSGACYDVAHHSYRMFARPSLRVAAAKCKNSNP